MVSKANVLSNPKRAAKHALAALAYVRSHSPFPVGDGEPAAPSVINKDGVKKGVVKLGWSWEARFVSIFHSEEDLAVKLTEMLTKEGCLAQTCLVQEWVDFDFEMRLYFLPPQGEDWAPGKILEPTRIECNAWGTQCESREEILGQSNGSFSKLAADKCVEQWKGDAEAWEQAKKQAVEMSQRLLAWLRTASSQPVPMIRLDFMAKRIGTGKARLH